MLEHALDTLPLTLGETYERILCNIEDVYKQYAVKVFQWLVHSETALWLGQLIDVLAIDTSIAPSFDPSRRLLEQEDLLRICPGLVTITKEIKITEEKWGSDWRVHFAHHSVKEYFTSPEISLGKAAAFAANHSTAQRAIATDCLAYMIHIARKFGRAFDRDSPQTCDELPLTDYARYHWKTHVKNTSNHGELLDHLIVELFTSPIFNLWYGPDPSTFGIERMRCAIDAGLQDIVLNLLESGTDLNGDDCLKYPPLNHAAQKNEVEIAKLLLRLGARVDGHDIRGKTALHEAAEHGNIDIVKLLKCHMDAVTTPESDDEDSLQSPLWLAARNGHDIVVEFLLDYEANVNRMSCVRANGVCDGSPLMAACDAGHSSTVRLLISKGTDVNAEAKAITPSELQRDSHGVLLLGQRDIHDHCLCVCALQQAVSSGQQEIVDILLDAGADINAYGDAYATPLQIAIARGNTMLSHRLIEAGADITAQGGVYGNALVAACHTGNCQLIDFLLQRRAGGDDLSGFFRSALQAASIQGHFSAVLLLLDNGADLYACEEETGSILGSACYGGDEPIVRLILDHGVDVNSKDSRYNSPLQAAAAGGNDVIVKLLLDMGADVNAQGGLWGNALQAAFGGLFVEGGQALRFRCPRYMLLREASYRLSAFQLLAVGADRTIDTRLRDRLEQVHVTSLNLELSLKQRVRSIESYNDTLASYDELERRHYGYVNQNVGGLRQLQREHFGYYRRSFKTLRESLSA
ncbi:MAG: hypothetical protein Q9222_005112 [Ikaeria aurantiellina]